MRTSHTTRGGKILCAAIVLGLLPVLRAAEPEMSLQIKEDVIIEVNGTERVESLEPEIPGIETVRRVLQGSRWRRRSDTRWRWWLTNDGAVALRRRASSPWPKAAKQAP